MRDGRGGGQDDPGRAGLRHTGWPHRARPRRRCSTGSNRASIRRPPRDRRIPHRMLLPWYPCRRPPCRLTSIRCAGRPYALTPARTRPRSPPGWFVSRAATVARPSGQCTAEPGEPASPAEREVVLVPFGLPSQHGGLDRRHHRQYDHGPRHAGERRREQQAAAATAGESAPAAAYSRGCRIRRCNWSMPATSAAANSSMAGGPISATQIRPATTAPTRGARRTGRRAPRPARPVGRRPGRAPHRTPRHRRSEQQRRGHRGTAVGAVDHHSSAEFRSCVTIDPPAVRLMSILRHRCGRPGGSSSPSPGGRAPSSARFIPLE